MQAKEILKERFNSAKDAADIDIAGMSKEFKSFVADIDKFIAQSSSMAGEDFDRAKEKLHQRVVQAKHLLDEQSDTISKRVRKSIAQTQEQVHDHPWSAIGATLALGVAVGLLLTRKK